MQWIDEVDSEFNRSPQQYRAKFGSGLLFQRESNLSCFPPMDLTQKLSILADAAKYDASCSSSGTERRDSRSGGLGSTTGAGICHSFTPDGRCVSLLKILLTEIQAGGDEDGDALIDRAGGGDIESLVADVVVLRSERSPPEEGSGK